MSKKNTLYRINFISQGVVYEIYAKMVTQSSIFGFIEISDFVFGEHSSVVVDPSEEKIKSEFQYVNTSYIPLHAILRIDCVSKKGTPKMTEVVDSNNKIKQFPTVLYDTTIKRSDP